MYDAFVAACETLRGLGARVDEVELPQEYFSSAADMHIIIAAEAYVSNAALIETDGPPLDPHVEARLMQGKAVTAAAYIRAREHQRANSGRFLAFLKDFAAVLTPTTAVPALPLDQVDETASTMSRLTRPVNYLGLSALAVPCGFDDAGCPLSFQIIGRPYDEEGVLRIGYAYEQVAPQRRRPKIDALV